MLKQAFAFVVFAFLSLLCFTVSTESSAVANEGEQIEGGKLASVSINSVPLQPPNGWSVPLQPPNGWSYSSSWCIVKPSTDQMRLQANIDFCCGQRASGPIIDCTIIQYGGPCYNPTNEVSDASAVMNLYYKAAGMNIWDCDFAGSGLIIYTDPSVDQCIYED